jgi:hypothetical protein
MNPFGFLILSALTGLSTLAFPSIKKAASPLDSIASMITLESGESFDESNGFYDDFTSGVDTSRWSIYKRVWGQVNGYVNGGVIPANVAYDSGASSLLLTARGQYDVKKEVSGVGSITDGSCTGACLVSNAFYAPGRFVTRFKPAARLGVCNAFWTYNEDSSSVNHEIDIEFPTIKDNLNDFRTVSFTNYVGSSTGNAVRLDDYLSDGNYHTFGFDWYYSANHKIIHYFIDGQTLATSSTNIPFLDTRITLGAWIPNNQNFVGLPLFEKAQMSVDYVAYIPFLNQSSTSQSGSLSSTHLASASEYPTSSTATPIVNQIANGDFEYQAVNSGKSLTNAGYTSDGTVTLSAADSAHSSYYASLSSGSSLSQSIDSVYASSSRDFAFSSLGKGMATLAFYDASSTLLSTQNIAIDDTAWTNHTLNDLVAPTSSVSLKITFQGSAALAVDDLSLVPHQAAATTTDSLGETSLANSSLSSSLPSVWTSKATVDWNASSSWKASCATYQQSSVILGCDETTATSAKEASISNYSSADTDSDSLTMRAIYQTTSAIDSTHFTQAMWMTYDVASFSDIAFAIAGYAIDPSLSYYHNLILYSTDQGSTYSVLTDQFLRNSAGKAVNEIDPYIVKGSSSAVTSSYTQIRFAFASIAYSIGGQGVKLSGVMINTKNAFESQLDQSGLCTLTAAKQKMMAVMNAEMSLTDQTAFASDLVSDGSGKTYAQRYAYLASYWASLSSGTPLQTPESLGEGDFNIPLLVFTGLAAVGSLLFIVRRRKKR